MPIMGLSTTLPYASLQLATSRTIAIAGDATDATWQVSFNGSADVSSALTLKTVATPGTYGDGSHVPTITVDAKGRITAISTNDVAAASLDWTSIVGVPTTVAGYGIVDVDTSTYISAHYATLASPTFVGTPSAPTQTLGANTSALATCAFVQSSLLSTTAVLITTSGSWTVPAGVTRCKVTVVGGSGGAAGSGSANTGNTGGISSFASYASATGGTGVIFDGVSTFTNGTSGIGTLGDTLIQPAQFWTGIYGYGGGANAGSGGVAIKFVTGLTPGNTVAVTVGNAGSGGIGSGSTGTSGIQGCVLIEY